MRECDPLSLATPVMLEFLSMVHPKGSVSRYAVVIVRRDNDKPIGLLVASASEAYAKGFARHFSHAIRPTWPDRKAVAIPVI